MPAIHAGSAWATYVHPTSCFGTPTERIVSYTMGQAAYEPAAIGVAKVHNLSAPKLIPLSGKQFFAIGMVVYSPGMTSDLRLRLPFCPAAVAKEKTEIPFYLPPSSR